MIPARRAGSILSLAMAGVLVGWAGPGRAQEPPAQVGALVECIRPGPRLALTFDDGPHPTLTPRVLEHLARHGARATFFVVGKQAAWQPGLVAAIHAAGNELAVHTQDHKDLARLSPAAALEQIRRGAQAVSQAAPQAQVVHWRAPYGSLPRALAYPEASLGLRHVGWDVDPMDWRKSRQAGVADMVLDHARPGGIVLLHDIHPTTAHHLPRILEGLARRGFVLTTVSQLSWPTCAEAIDPVTPLPTAPPLPDAWERQENPPMAPEPDYTPGRPAGLDPPGR